MQEERFYMDISSGGGPQGNCQQVDAWICKIAFLSSLWGHCVWGPIQFLQGVLLKTTWQSSFPGAFSATSATIWHTPPSSTFLLRRKPRLRILLKRLAEAPDPLAFLLWYLVKTFVNWQQLLISRTKDLNPSMSESEKPVTEANESRSLRISAQRKYAGLCLHMLTLKCRFQRCTAHFKQEMIYHARCFYSRCELLEEVDSVFDPLIHEASWMSLRRVLSRGGLVAFEATIIGSFHCQSFAQVLSVVVWVSRVNCAILFGEMCLCGRWPANISLTQEIKLMDAIDFGLSLCLCRNGCGFWWKLKTINSDKFRSHLFLHILFVKLDLDKCGVTPNRPSHRL